MIASSSFRDPSGFVFFQGGTPYRQINLPYKEHYDALEESGLYQALMEDGLLIPHEEDSSMLSDRPEAYRILKPEPIPFISYPYEWCFSQLKDAALITLEVQRRALVHGFTLKDASAFNIQFHNGRPVLMDTLSLDRHTAGRAWQGYHQFCTHFLSPLLLMSEVDVRLARLLCHFLDGIPLDFASQMLPYGSWLRSRSLLHVHLHARTVRRLGGTSPPANRNIDQRGLMALIENLQSGVEGIRARKGATYWADYEQSHSYSGGAYELKGQIVSEFLNSVAPRYIWDLGANIGAFSRVAASATRLIVAIDADHAATEHNYSRLKVASDRSILPLWIDLTNPSPGSGWENEEWWSLVDRGPADAVLALALLHHLALSNNVPFDRIARWLCRIARALVIEFVPKEDPQAQRLLASRPDHFSDYNVKSFESAFSTYFRIEKRKETGNHGRLVYLMTALPSQRP